MINMRFSVKPFMHDVEKIARHTLEVLHCSHRKILKYVWPFSNIMHERVDLLNLFILAPVALISSLLHRETYSCDTICFA